MLSKLPCSLYVREATVRLKSYGSSCRPLQLACRNFDPRVRPYGLQTPGAQLGGLMPESKNNGVPRLRILTPFGFQH